MERAAPAWAAAEAAFCGAAEEQARGKGGANGDRRQWRRAWWRGVRPPPGARFVTGLLLLLLLLLPLLLPLLLLLLLLLLLAVVVLLLTLLFLLLLPLLLRPGKCPRRGRRQDAAVARAAAARIFGDGFGLESSASGLPSERCNERLPRLEITDACKCRSFLRSLHDGLGR